MKLTHFLSILAAAAMIAAPASAAGPKNDILLKAMKTELARSVKKLRRAEKNPMYFLGYEARDTRTADITAELGALSYTGERHYRNIDVDVRIGSRRLDNTHQIKGRQGWYESGGGRITEITIDDDEDALRAAIWLRTDKAYKDAQTRFTKVKTNKAVTAEEEDKSDDFSVEKPLQHYQRVSPLKLDRARWEDRLRSLSAAFKSYPFIIDSNVHLSLRSENRYIVTTEGTEVVTGDRYIRLSYNLSARTKDGMDLARFHSYNGNRMSDLPDNKTVLADIKKSAGELKALYQAPLVEPYTGPAIFKNKAAGVYFHEILGHRLEGHRQKLEEEGQTFTKRLGKSVTASFISVYDDPTLERLNGTFLRGHYRFDDEGQPAQRVSLVENGILKGFLLSRSPIKGFPNSNGHGRRSAGQSVVARMGNIIVESSISVPYSKLREMLISEIKKQNKPYGLIFEDISGGFTTTSRHGPQSFKVIPLLVWRVYPDGRADEPVRGVDIVGTPQASFQKIIAAADDTGIFNGTCGAESGWVPVSAAAPSILVSEIEVEKKFKMSEKPPVLPPPHHDPKGKRRKR